MKARKAALVVILVGAAMTLPAAARMAEPDPLDPAHGVSLPCESLSTPGLVQVVMSALATSGSTQLILWPFQGNDGPMGKTPRLLAPTEAQVEAIACHPKQEVVAVGYADGLILMVRIEDGAEVLARKPAAAPIAALAWSAAGNMLAFGTEDGEAGVIDL